MTDKEIDEIHTAVDVLLKAECYKFLDVILFNMQPKIWRLDVAELVTYATATLPAKSKLPSRGEFMRKATTLHQDEELWKGLL